MDETKFTPEEEQELARLLRKVANNRGFWPTEETFYLSTEVAAQFATELAIFRRGGLEVLLTLYEKSWKGSTGWWHLPGGWAKPKMDADIAAICNRVTKRELGIEVRVLGTIGEPYWWKLGEHDDPESRPLSLYAVAEPIGEIVETDGRRFFPINNPPTPLIGGSHEHFFRNWTFYTEAARSRGFLLPEVLPGVLTPI